MTYAAYLRRLSRINPSDYQDDGTQAHLTAVAAGLDDVQARARAVMLARLISTAPEDALRTLAAERNLQRYPGEHLGAFRYRVLQAWVFWAQAGTVRGMLAALEHMGYGIRLAALNGDTVQGVFPDSNPYGVVLTQISGSPPEDGVYTLDIDGQTFTLPYASIPDDFRYAELPPTQIIEHWREDRAIWAEFSLHLTPSDPSLNADVWDDGSRWDDGTLWDLTIRQEEVDRIRAVIGEIKPAHARLRGIYLVNQWGQDYWDDETNWDDGTVWDAQRPTALYQRPGV